MNNKYSTNRFGTGRSNYDQNNRYEKYKVDRTGRQPLEFNFVLMGITAVCGIVSFIVCNFVYDAMNKIWQTPWLIGILFLLIGLIVSVAVLIYSITGGIFEDNVFLGGSGFISAVGLLLAGAVLIFLLAAFFQWIYQLEFGKDTTEPTSYIFVIDDSGSMLDNDPSQARFQAISTVTSDLEEDFPIMVYLFSDSVTRVRDMMPIRQGEMEISGSSDGGTAIRAALTQVVEDYENGVWDGGENPKVILLTDGYAGDIGFFSSVNPVLKKYVKAGISISTVGLGNVDVGLMNTIAKSTGGVFIDISDAMQLNVAMKSAAVGYAERDLLSNRYSTKFGFLYGAMRIVFLTILGTILGVMAALAYGMPSQTALILLSSIIKAFLGAVLMEIATGLLDMPAKPIWCIVWILFATTIANHYGVKLRADGAYAKIR